MHFYPFVIQIERAYFRRVENKREYFGRVQSSFKAPLQGLKGIYVGGHVMYILRRRRNMLLYFNMLFLTVVHIFDASKVTLNYNSSIFRQRVKNVKNASPKYATIFQCYIGCGMQIFDASKMTFMTPPPE